MTVNLVLIGIYVITIVLHVLTIRNNLKAIRIYRDRGKK